MKKQNDDRHSGSSFDSFLEEQHILEEVEAVALKRVLAWQLKQAMTQQQITKQKMAKQLGTSRSQVDRLLDPSYTGTSIATVSKAAHAIGKRIRLEIVDSEPNARAAHRRRAPSGISRSLTSKKKRA
jgi:antitoxin HicB